MRRECRYFDVDGECLPDNALSTEGAFYAETAKAQRLELWACRLENACLEAYDEAGYRFRRQMTDAAHERTNKAYDAYRERCEGVQVCTVTYYTDSRYEEGYPTWETITA